MKRLTPAIVRKMHLGRTPQAVMLLILQKARTADSCYLGQAEISESLAVSERQCRRALASLESLGLITREARKDRRGYRTTDRVTVHHDAWSVVPRRRNPTGHHVLLANRSECPVGQPDTMSAPIEYISNTSAADTSETRRDENNPSPADTPLTSAGQGPTLTLIPGGKAA